MPRSRPAPFAVLQAHSTDYASRQHRRPETGRCVPRWRWRISSAATAKRSVAAMALTSAGSSDVSWQRSSCAERRRSEGTSSSAATAGWFAAPTTPAATDIVRSARVWRAPSGSRRVRPSCCRCRTTTWSSPYHRRWRRSRSRTSVRSTPSCSTLRPMLCVTSPPSTPKRKPLPDHLPREDVVHQPPGDGACICPECGAGWPNWARTSPRCWITWQGTSRSSVTWGQASPVAIAVGTLITQRPRTEPSEPDSGTRLPRWVFDGKADTRPRVENTRAREPVVRQLANPLPVHRILLAPSPKRTMPQGGDIVAEGLQRVAVRRHRVVVEKASKPAPLLRDRLVHALPQFLCDLQELRPHSVPSGPPLEEEAPLSGCSADEGKPTKNLNFGAKSK